MYVDGRPIATRMASGDVSNWDASFRFALANELTGDRPWLGDYHAVVVYDTALTAKDVADRFQAGVVASPARRPLLHYSFREKKGDVVRDVSETGPPLNLKIEKLEAVRWLPDGGLRIASPTLIVSAAAADKIVQAIDRNGELTIEAWVQPANTTQSGPARIVLLTRKTGCCDCANREIVVRFGSSMIQ